MTADVGAGGTPDVFGSRDGDVLFVEVKRYPDRLKQAQAAWFEKALTSGITSWALLVANWSGVAG